MGVGGGAGLYTLLEEGGMDQGFTPAAYVGDCADPLQQLFCLMLYYSVSHQGRKPGA